MSLLEKQAEQRRIEYAERLAAAGDPSILEGNAATALYEQLDAQRGAGPVVGTTVRVQAPHDAVENHRHEIVVRPGCCSMLLRVTGTPARFPLRLQAA